MSASDGRVVLITAGSAAEGERIAEALVGERLAACVNRVDGVRSVYRWQGEVERAEECLLIAKTTAACLERLIARTRELHAYSVPEIIALPIEAGSPASLDWIRDSVTPRER